MTEIPNTKYAKSGDVSVAYQVLGDGPIDLVYAPGFLNHLEMNWEHPVVARFFERLASFSRLIMFDKRGTGMSDHTGGAPTLEERMDDLRAVMDAASSERAALFGVSEGGALSIMFAATYPERTRCLITYAAVVRHLWAEDWPFGHTVETLEAFRKATDETWGTGVGVEFLEPSLGGDDVFREWWARYQRMCMSPGAVRAMSDWLREIDIRHVLPAISVPTLVLHRQNDIGVSVEQGRYASTQIPGAKYVELPGQAHFPWLTAADDVLEEIEEFITGARSSPEPDRVLATVLFTDIVGSTQKATELGDRKWRELLERHDALIRREVEGHRGRLIDTAGDGVLSTFDGPARAVRCACSIGEKVRTLGVEVRAGLHTGEIELKGDDVAGIAVHIGARVSALAGPGEVLVSRTVTDLVAGSGLSFEERGEHELKGVPGSWAIYAVNV